MPRYGLVARPPNAKPQSSGVSMRACGNFAYRGTRTHIPGRNYTSEGSAKTECAYTLGLLSGIDVEQAADVCPDVLWYQLYRFARNDHAIGFDLVRRAAAAGVKTLVLTMDTPTRTIKAS